MEPAMPYRAEISRRNPTCFVFLIDQSESMIRPFAGSGDNSKAQGVAAANNSLLRNLIFASTTGTGLADRFHIAVIGYGKSVGSAFSGPLSGRLLVPISDLGNNPLRILEMKDWVRAPSGVMVERNGSQTNLGRAQGHGQDPDVRGSGTGWPGRRRVHRCLWGMLSPNGRQPFDGQATDGDPLAAAESLQMLFSDDGNVLLFNIHLSGIRRATGFFTLHGFRWMHGPSTATLFEMSSPLPESYYPIARRIVTLNDGARGFAFNADMNSLVQFLNIGTQSTFA